MFVMKLTIAALCLLFGCSESTSNLTTVDPGRFYRTSQPSIRSLSQMVEHYNIKTVINLRGDHDSIPASAKSEMSHIYKIDFLDMPLSTNDDANVPMLTEIRKNLYSIEFPAIVYCKWGLDRTGFVVAVYEYEFMNDSQAFKKLGYRSSRFVTPKVDQWASLYQITFPKFNPQQFPHQ